MVAIKSELNKVRAITWERVKDATQAEFHELLQLIHKGFPESKGYLPEKLGEFWEYHKKLFVFDNVVLMQDRVVIPPSLRKRVLLALHSAHQGVSGMGLNVQSTVFWPGIIEDVQAIRDQCRPCIRNDPSQAKLPPHRAHYSHNAF